MSELFNQSSVKTSLDLGQRMASGVPNQIGCDNITVQDFLKQMNGIIEDVKSANFTYLVPADSILRAIDFKKISGTPTVKVGTTLGGDELVSETTIAGYYTNAMRERWISPTTIYFTVSGGTVKYTMQITTY